MADEIRSHTEIKESRYENYKDWKPVVRPASQTRRVCQLPPRGKTCLSLWETERVLLFESMTPKGPASFYLEA